MPSKPFRVALSASFQAADGSPVYPSFDLAPLTDNADVDLFFLPASDPIDASALENSATSLKPCTIPNMSY